MSTPRTSTSWQSEAVKRYEYHLKPVLDWVAARLGFTESKLHSAIKALPWPDGDPDDWKPPFDGTKMDHTLPTQNNFKWMLRYLQLAGYVEQRGNRQWYAVQEWPK